MKLIIILLFLSVLKVSTSSPLTSHTDRIVGGKNAAENSAPFIVTIQFYPLTRAEGLPIHVCGGAVISDSWVTTAAHCIIGLLPDEVDVYAGVYDLSDTGNGKVQKRNVENLILHPDYVGDVAPYDLGLIRVTRPFDFNDHVQPINLPVKDRIHNGMVYVFGWGDGLDPSKFNDKLQTALLPIINYDDCTKIVNNPSLNPTNVCTGFLTGGKGSCAGDSGGPVIKTLSDGEQILVGIQSWGYMPCGTPNTASVQVRVSAFIDFIKGHVNDHP